MFGRSMFRRLLYFADYCISPTTVFRKMKESNEIEILKKALEPINGPQWPVVTL